jgi:hypothetical protein
MAVSIDLSKGLDQTYEDKSLEEILDASPAALAGVTDADAQLLDQASESRRSATSAPTKYFALAGVLVALSNKL